jgi:hypothetical protein
MNPNPRGGAADWLSPSKTVKFGQATGGKREYFGTDGYSFGRLGKVETRKELAEFARLCRRLSWRKHAKKWWATATPEQKVRVPATVGA